MRQQHLGSGQAMRAEAGFVDLRQAHLADRGAGLQFMDSGRAAFETETLHPFGNSARADQNDFLAELAQVGDLRRPVGDGSRIEPLAVVGDERGADLDDDAFGFLNDGVHVLLT